MLDKVGSAKGVEEMRIQLKQQVSLEWQPLLLLRQLHLCFVRSTLVAVTGYRKNRGNWNQQGRDEPVTLYVSQIACIDQNLGHCCLHIWPLDQAENLMLHNDGTTSALVMFEWVQSPVKHFSSTSLSCNVLASLYALLPGSSSCQRACTLGCQHQRTQ